MAVILEFPRSNGDNGVDAEIVSILTNYLEEASSGQLRSMIVLTAGTDGRPQCAIQIDRGDAASLLGTLRVAENRLTTALDEIID